MDTNNNSDNMDPVLKHYLYPGDIFAKPSPHSITTVLGSCIAVCMYDYKLKIGGMNHYLLPFWNGEGLASPRYGNIAIPKLLEKLLSLGSERKNLRAKVFGGGMVLSLKGISMDIGNRNTIYAMDYLKEMRIPIESHSVGGNQGRRIVFETHTAKVLMKRLAGNSVRTVRVKG